jgi:hypothetical protein
MNYKDKIMKTFQEFLFEKADSKKQMKLIYTMREKYGTAEKAPEKWKWIFSKDWDLTAAEWKKTPEYTSK